MTDTTGPMIRPTTSPMTRETEWRFAEPTLRWHGWDSPLGLGIALISVGVSALLLRPAITGV
jgi:hypothetical protein